MHYYFFFQVYFNALWTAATLIVEPIDHLLKSMLFDILLEIFIDLIEVFTIFYVLI